MSRVFSECRFYVSIIVMSVVILRAVMVTVVMLSPVMQIVIGVKMLVSLC
jgi:hypothetical protein